MGGQLSSLATYLFEKHATESGLTLMSLHTPYTTLSSAREYTAPTDTALEAHAGRIMASDSAELPAAAAERMPAAWAVLIAAAAGFVSQAAVAAHTHTHRHMDVSVEGFRVVRTPVISYEPQNLKA